MGMSRARAVPPDTFTDEDLLGLPYEVRLTEIGLRLHADDQGRETCTTWQLKASIWPGNREVTEETLVEHLLLIEDAGRIAIYADDRRTYYAFVDWPKPSHPAPSKFPPPPRRNADGTLTEPFSAGERARESGAEGGPSDHPGVPPSPFCPDHQPSGSSGVPCVRCRDARMAHEQWIREHVGTDDR